MANTVVFETKMSDRMQITRYSTGVYTAQASFEERAKLSRGQAVTRPFLDRFYEQDYTRGSDLTIPDKVETNETLTVNTAKATPFYVDDLDKVQSNFNLMASYSDRAMRALSKSVDADYLGEAANATTSIDGDDVTGGSAATAITIDTSNVLEIFSATQRALQQLNVDITGQVDPRPASGNLKPGGGAGFANLHPRVYEKLILSLSGRESVQGDQVGKNGYMSTYFSFDNYVTTNGLWTGVIGMATNPTNGDTIVINGVTFTFNTTPAAAGSIDIGGSADATRALLADAINNTDGNAAGAGSATTYFEVSAANRNLLARMTATNDDTGNTCTVVAEGYGFVAVSETFTDATDAWDTEVSSQLFGKKGAVDMVVQVKPQVKVSDIPLQLGSYVKPHVLYGLTTFTEGQDALASIEINSATWT